MPRTAAPMTAVEIDAFTRKLKATLALAQQALAIQAALGKAGAVAAPAAKPVARTAGKPAIAPTKKAGRRTRRPGLAPEKVAAVLGEKGLSLAEVAAKVGEKDKDRVAVALRKARDAKKAKVVGDRIKARWFAA